MKRCEAKLFPAEASRRRVREPALSGESREARRGAVLREEARQSSRSHWRISRRREAKLLRSSLAETRNGEAFSPGNLKGARRG